MNSCAGHTGPWHCFLLVLILLRSSEVGSLLCLTLERNNLLRQVRRLGRCNGYVLGFVPSWSLSWTATCQIHHRVVLPWLEQDGIYAVSRALILTWSQTCTLWPWKSRLGHFNGENFTGRLVDVLAFLLDTHLVTTWLVVIVCSDCLGGRVEVCAWNRVACSGCKLLPS